MGPKGYRRSRIGPQDLSRRVAFCRRAGHPPTIDVCPVIETLNSTVFYMRKLEQPWLRLLLRNLELGKAEQVVLMYSGEAPKNGIYAADIFTQKTSDTSAKVLN